MHALQVKWKGNGKIDPKYVHYVVQFLERLGMTVGENEMKNLGYYKLDSIDKDLFCDNMYNGYVYENNLDKIKYKDWEQYNWTWLLRIKKLVELKLDFQLKWNFDLSSIVSYVIRKANEHSSTAVANESYSTAVANESYSTAVANEHSSTAVANESYSTAVANKSCSTAVANKSYSTAVANKSSSTAVANEHSSTAVANESYSTAVANKSYSTAVANEHSSTAVANESCSTAVANESYSTAVANEHSSTAVANDHSSTAVANKSYSTAVANGKNSIALTRSYKSKCRGKIGAWLVISEWDKMEENIIGIQAKKVDWVEIKENTFYTLKDWKFIEVPWN